ncbi:MAG: helix-turn-helix transcriptional regulator [Lachnospiraceae bacterium]|nr:helix-turn-helix transcriptional regulator [Lachnospiraceae bacterium]
MIKSVFSCRLRCLRKKAGLTQEEVAKHLNIERQTYCNYENDSRTPPLETIIRLADFYRVTLDDLVRDGKQDISLSASTSQTLNITEKALVESFRSLPSQSQREVLQFIQFKSALQTNAK